MLTVLIISNLILAIFTSIFIIKEILISFKESKRKTKNIGIFIFSIVSLFLSLVAGKESFFISQQKDVLKNDLIIAEKAAANNVISTRKDEIQLELKALEKDEDNLIVFTLLGYLSFGSLLLLHRSIIKEIKELKPEGTWNLNKFN